MIGRVACRAARATSARNSRDRGSAPTRLKASESPACKRRHLVGQARQRRQAEDRADRFDDGVVVALGMRDRAGARVRRDQQQRDADAARQRQAVGTIGQNARRHVIVEAVGFVIGDDDRALAPERRIRGDGVDDARGHRLGDLMVAIARMIVVAGLGGVDRRDFRPASGPPGWDNWGSGSAASDP